MVNLSISEISGSEMGDIENSFDVTEKSRQTVPDSPQDSLITKDRVIGEKYIQNQLLHARAYYPEKGRASSYKQRNYNVDSDYVYDMTGSPAGVMVIFNIREFEVSTGLQDYPREGSDVDAKALKDVFLELGFVVCIYNDVSKKNIFEAITEICLRYSTLSCFACAVLSHGLEGHFYATDRIVKYSDLFSILESPYWVGKPKLFFLQSCLGAKHMDSLRPDGLDEVDAPTIIDPVVPLPRHSDFFYAYSTVPGYSSWRNTHQGSWFIQEICNAFRKYSNELDLSRMMTRANAQITLRVTETNNDETNDKRQVISTVNQLRKDLYFVSGDIINSHVKHSRVETYL